MSNKINPNLLAAGIGGLAGANFMSTGDNDLIATATGAAIGVGTGYMLDTNLTDSQKRNIDIVTGNKETIIDPEQVRKEAQTFSEKKREVRELAERIAKERKGIQDFDRNKPFTTLTENNLDDFLVDLDNIKSDESLTKLRVALKSGKDSLFINKSDLSSSLQIEEQRTIKIQAGSDQKTKMAALREEFVRLGYPEGSPDLENKLKMFEGLMAGHGHDEQITIKDGKLNLSRGLSLNLTFKSVADNGDVAIQYSSNKNIYNVPRVSFTASALNEGLDNKAVADALGITMADAFKDQIEREMKEVAGLAPDEAAALAYKNLKNKPEQFKELVSTLNGMGVYDGVASGQYKENLRTGVNTFPTPSVKAVAISNTVDYSRTLNLLDNGKIDTNKPFRTTGTTSGKGAKRIPEIREFTEKKLKQTGIPNAGTSADHVTEMVTTQMEKVGHDGKIYLAPSVQNNLFSVNTSFERNPVTVYNRNLVHETSDLPHKAAFDYIINKAGASSQFGSALPLQTMSLDTSLSIPDRAKGNQSKLFIDSIAEVFGSNIVVADGSGLGNRDVLKKISTEGFVNLNMTPTTDETFLFSDEYHKKVATGEMSFDEFKSQAKKGISVIQGRAESSVKKTVDKLTKLQTATSSAKSVTEVLDSIQRAMPSLIDVNSNEVKSILGQTSGQVESLIDYGKTKILNSLPETTALYSSKDSSLTETALEARRSVVNKLSVVGNRDLGESINLLTGLLEQNQENKQYRVVSESFFPKAGKVLGYNSDGTAVALKQNYRSYEFTGAFWNEKTSSYSDTTDLNLSFKGRTVAGDESEMKSYGLSTKAQLQNVSSDIFQKTLFLQDLATENSLSMDSVRKQFFLDVKDIHGKDRSLTISEKDLKNNSIENIFSSNKIELPEDTLNKIRDYKSVAVIAEDDSSGTLKHRDLLNAMVKGEDITERSSSAFLGSYLQDKVTRFKGDKNSLEGLADFVLATSKDKSAMDYLLTAHTSVVRQSGLRLSAYTKAVGTEKQTLLEEMKRYSREMFGIDMSHKTSITKEEWGSAMSSRLDNVMKYHTSSGFSSNFYNMAKDPDTLDNFVDFFIQERKFRDPSLGNGLYRATALGGTVEHELGSGTTQKTASWNSMSQLRMSGFSNEDIGLFGKMSSHNVADFESVNMLTKHLSSSINNTLDDDSVRKVIGLNPNQRRDALKELGVDTNKLVESYSLKNENSMGIKSLPVLLEDTRLFGDYTDEEGFLKSKRLSKDIKDAIDLDMRISTSTSELERTSAKELLDTKLKGITESILPLMGGRDNIGKKLATLEAPNSIYSLASPVGGKVKEALTDAAGNVDNHVAVVNTKGLLLRLNEVGNSFESLEDVRKAGLLKQTSEKGIFEVFYDKEQKVPMFSMLTREPSVGMGSTTSVRYLLDSSIKGDAKNIYTMYDNKIFKSFKMQDFDMDHFIEILPKVDKNYEHLSEVFEKGKVINKQLDDMLDFASHLGVKGKDKHKIGTFFDLIDLPEVDSKEKFMDAFLEDTFLSKAKGGDRKTVSPEVTKLAFTMNTALSADDLNFDQLSKARIMSHYLVENLLKSQHISNENYKKQPIALASKLAEELNKGRVDGFNEKFGQYVEDNIIKPGLADGKMKEDMAEQIRETYKQIQSSMSSAQAKGILNGDMTPTHLKSRNPNNMAETSYAHNLKEANQNLTDMVTKSKLGVVSTIDQEVINSMSSTLAGRVKKSYHNSLENTKQIISNNKKLLAGAAAATIGAALLTQDKPSFGNNTVSANTNGMLMEASRNAIEETREQQSIMGGVHRATDYLYSYQKGGGSSISVEGSSHGRGGTGDITTDMNNFMYGDGMSSIRILTG